MPCQEAGDYANPIESSVQGGAKIVVCIARLVTIYGEAGSYSTVIAH
jgi:hypothetical protein